MTDAPERAKPYTAIVGAIVVAVAMRTEAPLLMHPSPRKSPATNNAITASLPVSFVKDSFTTPSLRQKTLSPESLCVKICAFLRTL
jgi:hypothetical protein